MNLRIRVWEIPSKEYHYDINELQRDPSIVFSELFNGSDSRFVAQMYTGIYDENNREICEGDIVEFHIEGKTKNKKNIGVVKFSKRRAAFMFKILNQNFSVLIANNIPTNLGLIDDDINCKIIGNTYQNSEFLTKLQTTVTHIRKVRD